ncbi:MAG: beta-phosphoglucomutase [Spirochaetaceae bacterium]|nr:MAG: beta-phosphoglucomutase [Spirochaetaceae bacterium]
MSEQAKALIFDLDGVVVFTDKYHYLGWKKLADENGWSFDEEFNNNLRGVSRMKSLELMLEHNGLDLPEDEKNRLADRKNEYYKELLQRINESDLYPGAVGFVKKVRELGLKTALASSSKNAQAVLVALDLEPLFDAVVTGNDITRSKPDPEIFLLAAKKLGMKPEDCVVFEDAESGVEAAHRAGMRAVGVGPVETVGAAEIVMQDYAELDLENVLSGA